MSRVMKSLIYEVSPHDLTTFLVVSFVLVAVSFGASLAPALRAARIQPLEVLREE
jgi:ABC-type lipoprotein release transport system permease subunit